MSYWLGILAAAITAATIAYGLGEVHHASYSCRQPSTLQTEGHW